MHDWMSTIDLIDYWSFDMHCSSTVTVKSQAEFTKHFVTATIRAIDMVNTLLCCSNASITESNNIHFIPMQIQFSLAGGFSIDKGGKHRLQKMLPETGESQEYNFFFLFITVAKSH